MSDFSRLDYLISAVLEDGDYPMSAVIARKELSALRARVAELEAAANTMRSTFDALIGSGDTTALTPRNCEACKRGAERMREAAAKIVDYMEIDSDNPQFSEIADRDDEMAVKIRALPLDCGDCNPLKPEA